MQYRRTVATFLLAVPAFLPAARPAIAQTPATRTEPVQNMARLQNFGTLVAFLNLAAGTVRLVAILEPSSPECDSAIDALQSVLDANSSKRLRAYVVWTRVSAADTEMRALSMANRGRDRRMVHFWDAEAVVADSFRGVLESGESPATGVLLLYDTDARLALAPPAPATWMSVNPTLAGDALDAAQLGAHANAMVRRVEAKASDVTPPKP